MAEFKLVSDSSVIINHLNGKLDLEAFFSDIPDAERYISIITAIEVLSKQGMTAGEEKTITSFLDQFAVVDITQRVKNEAIVIRRATKMKLPDAVIAATAIALDATLLSNDPHLLYLVWPNFKVQSV
jgi:predicted nucleic acid-binding protein